MRTVISLVFLLILVAGFGIQSGAAQDETGENAGWTRIEPGGETLCARGTPYAFWVHEGTSDNIMLHFQGGGACWNDDTCELGSSAFAQNALYDDNVSEDDNPANAGGIFDTDNPDNPFQDYTMVLIPYCTGDIHWGGVDRTYIGVNGEEYVQHHRGFINGTAVLDWLAESYSEAETVAVTGCSAGGYGAAAFAPYVIEQYEGARVVHLSDSSAGVTPPAFIGYANWGLVDNLPEWIPEMEALTAETFNSTLYYAAMTGYYPQNTFSQFNYAFDGVQIAFSALTDIPSEEWNGAGTLFTLGNLIPEYVQPWTESMQASVGTLDEASNFVSYTAQGDEHCVLPLDSFYTTEVEGVALVDWVQDMLAGEPIETVACTDCAPVEEE